MSTSTIDKLELSRIAYSDLNARQRENYNFQKAAAHLADFGFNCLRLSDDWNGADFIACHIDGSTFIKVQLKGRMSLQKQYVGKDIYIAFFDKGSMYLYPHDELLDYVSTNRIMTLDAPHWDVEGKRNWNTLPRWAIEWLHEYKV